MMYMNMIAWGILFAVAVIAEAVTLQLVSVWFAAGALVAFIMAALGLPMVWQAIVFTTVSAILLCVTRPLIKKIQVKDVIPTNADAEVGKTAIVTEEINSQKDTGRVKIGGVNWKARSEVEGIFPVGSTMVVKRISGTTAFVAPMEKTTVTGRATG
ncbi:MAG: NfeD family protein [Oscillospiraceae bacterium]